MERRIHQPPVGVVLSHTKETSNPYAYKHKKYQTLFFSGHILPRPPSGIFTRGVEIFSDLGALVLASAARDFLSSANWLGPEHKLGGLFLVRACEKLDDDFTPALISQAGLMYRFLINLKPDNVEFNDPLEQLLKR
jgi:hypothetical protein